MGLHYRDSYRNFENPNGPNVDFVANDSNIYVHDTVAFTDKSIGMSTWFWTILPMTYTYIDGTSKASQNPKVIFNNEGLYSVSLIGTLPTGGGNKKVKLNYINVTHNTGIEPQILAIKELELYPNPTNGNISILLDNSSIGNQARLTVTNTTGQEIINQLINCDQEEISLNIKSRNPGLYFVKLQFDNHAFGGKVIIR